MSSSAALQYKDGGEQPPSNPFVNKYIFPEFAGFAGYRLLYKIIGKIIKKSHKRTWDLTTRHQINAKPAYVGTYTVSEEDTVSQRRIQADLQEMKERGLVIITYGEEVINGELCQVTYKDFTPLYYLAHEYYLWMQKGGEKAYPPERESIERIKADPKRYQQLMRFNNYRKILTTRKPGPTRTPLEPIHIYTSDADIATNLLVNLEINSSPYRITLNESPLLNQEEYSNHSNVPPTDMVEVAQEDSPVSTHPYDDVIVEQEEDDSTEETRSEEGMLSPSQPVEQNFNIQEPAAPTADYTNKQTELHSYSLNSSHEGNTPTISSEPEQTSDTKTDETGASEAVTLPFSGPAAPAKDVIPSRPSEPQARTQFVDGRNTEVKRENSHDRQRKRARHSDNSRKEVDSVHTSEMLKGDTREKALHLVRKRMRKPYRGKFPMPLYPTGALESAMEGLRDEQLNSSKTRAGKQWLEYSRLIKIAFAGQYPEPEQEFGELIYSIYERIKNKKFNYPNNNGAPYFFKYLENECQTIFAGIQQLIDNYSEQERLNLLAEQKEEEIRQQEIQRMHALEQKRIQREMQLAHEQWMKDKQQEKDISHRKTDNIIPFERKECIVVSDPPAPALEPDPPAPALEPEQAAILAINAILIKPMKALKALQPCRNCGSTIKCSRGKKSVFEHCPICNAHTLGLTENQEENIIQILLDLMPENQAGIQRLREVQAQIRNEPLS